MKRSVFLAGLVCAAAWLFFGCVSAESLVQKGRESSSLVDAEKRYQQALDRDPGNTELKETINEDLLRRYLPVIKKGGAEGDKAYEKAAALVPDNADIYYNRGYAFFISGDYVAAAGLWQKALEINPSYDIGGDFSIPSASVTNIGLRNLKNNLSLKNASLFFALGIAYHDIVKNKKVPAPEFGAYLEKAVDAFKKGYDIDIVQKKNTIQDVKAAYLVFIADVSAQIGNNDDAVKYYRELYNARDITYDKSGVAAILTRLLGDKIFETRITTAGTTRTVVITGYAGYEKSLTIPEAIGGIPVTAIGERAFAQKQLTSVIIPETVTSIGKEAFSGNALTRIDIGGSIALEDAGFDSRFVDSYSAHKKTADTYFSYSGAWLSNTDLYSVKIEGTGASRTVTIVGYTGKETDVRIPAKIGGVPVTAIGSSAFLSRGLTRVVIPQGVKTIGMMAFAFCPLKILVLPDSLEKIEANAFSMTNLELVVIPGSVREIESGAFEKMTGEIRDITIGANVNVASDAFGTLNRFALDYNNAGKMAGRYLGKETGRRMSALVKEVIYTRVSPSSFRD